MHLWLVLGRGGGGRGARWKDNVALELAGVSDEEVQEACRGVMLDEFVSGFGGYETILDGDGIRLSG